MKDGSIATAHCTCMAGNSEVCSHIGAILFAAEFANIKQQTVSCTDMLSTWPMPSTSTEVPIVHIYDMDWGKPLVFEGNCEVKFLTAEEIHELIEISSSLGEEPVLNRIVEPFATQMFNKKVNPLTSIFNLFKEEHFTKSHCQLMEISRKIDLQINKQNIADIEEATRKQHECDIWYTQRAGRITASKFKAVCKTNMTKSFSKIQSNFVGFAP